jgi:hypothetical protein
MLKKPKINIEYDLCKSVKIPKDFSNSQSYTTTNRNQNIKTSFSPNNNIILSKSILNSFKLPKHKKKIVLYPKIGQTRNNIIENKIQSSSSTNKEDINFLNSNNNINKIEFSQTSMGFHNRFFSNPKISFEQKYENLNLHTEKNTIKNYLNSQPKLILNSPSKETTFNTYTNTNILFNKDEILNFETPEDYHIFNVNVIQKGKKLAYKFENMESSKIEIKKIGEEF